jgi:hypothetical protein
MSKNKLAAVAAAVVAIAAGTTAYAAIPDGAGTIHGCYDKSSGALRVTDSATNTPKGCSNKEIALDWNQQGPKGDKGDPGPSLAREAEGSATITATSNYGTEVAEMNIPGCAGCSQTSWVFSAKLVAQTEGLNVAPETVACELAVDGGGGGADPAYGTVSSNASGPVMISTLAMQRNWIFPGAGGTASVWCDAPHTADAYDVQLTGIQVGKLVY